MKNMTLITILLLVSMLALAQQEQAGDELTTQFPTVTDGNVEPDLPANGFWWDKNNPGMGINLEIQKRPASSTGYFMFLAGYFYDDNKQQFWCVASEDFKFNTDVHQWRSAKSFSNLKAHSGGHNNPSVLAEQDVTCYVMQDGSTIGTNTPRPAQVERSIALHLLFRSPSELELTAAGGEVQHFTRLAMHDNLTEPSMDWIKDYTWRSISSISVFAFTNELTSNTEKTVYQVSGFTKYDSLDARNLPYVRAMFGDKPHYKYYISQIKHSYHHISFFDEQRSSWILGAVPAYEPYVWEHQDTTWYSSVAYSVLAYDSQKNRVMLGFFAGDGEDYSSLRVFKFNDGHSHNSNPNLVFVANVNPDANIMDFYPMLCEGDSSYYHCSDDYDSENLGSMTHWSKRNIQRNTLKLFKVGVGGEAYEYLPFTGEADAKAMERLRDQLYAKGVLPFTPPGD